MEKENNFVNVELELKNSSNYEVDVFISEKADNWKKKKAFIRRGNEESKLPKDSKKYKLESFLIGDKIVIKAPLSSGGFNLTFDPNHPVKTSSHLVRVDTKKDTIELSVTILGVHGHKKDSGKVIHEAGHVCDPRYEICNG